MATVAELNRDLRLLAQVVDSMARNLNMYANLQRDIQNLHKMQDGVIAKQEETVSTISKVRQDIDLLRMGHREIISRASDIEGGHVALRSGIDEINVRNDEMKKELMHLHGV